MQVQSLGQEDPLEEGSNPLQSSCWRIPWTEEPGGLQSIGLQRVRQDWLSMHAQAMICFLNWYQLYEDYSLIWFVNSRGGFPGGANGKESDCNAGDLGLIFGLGISPGEGNGNPLQYSCWRIPWTEEPGGLQSMGLQRVRHDWATQHSTAIFKYIVY